MTEENDDIYQHSDVETAVIQGNKERFEELIDGADLDSYSDSGRTLLHKAAAVGPESVEASSSGEHELNGEHWESKWGPLE